jgi:predicted MFS family arabinose efflux permease
VPGLLPLTCAIVLVDTIFFSALTPLLPQYVASLGLSKADAGLLAGAFAAGVLVAAVPSGALVTAIGLRPTVWLGLGLTAVTTLAFGLGTTWFALYTARFAGGLGSACSWTATVTWLTGTAPPGRRGEMIGLAISAAVVGSLIGPIVGSAAAWVGPTVAFGGLAFVCVVLAGWVALTPAPSAASGVRPAGEQLLMLLRPELAPAVGLIVLTPLLFGVFGVLVPLALSSQGWTTPAIAALWVVIAIAETLVHPLFGRWADRRGWIAPVKAGLVGSVIGLCLLAAAERPWTLAVFAGAAAVAFGATLVPGMARLSRIGDEIGLDTAWSFGLSNFAWALGHAIGAPFGGALGGAAGDRTAYLVLAGVCLVALGLARRLDSSATANEPHTLRP